MKMILNDQVGFLPGSNKRAVLNFDAPGFRVVDEKGDVALRVNCHISELMRYQGKILMLRIFHH